MAIEWKEEREEHTIIRLTSEQDGVTTEIDNSYVDENNGFKVGLTMSRETVYKYNTLDTTTTANSQPNTHVQGSTTLRQVTLRTWYVDFFKTIEEAKAKAEELMPIFRNVG